MSFNMADLDAVAERRAFLSKHGPLVCPRCGYEKQNQLMHDRKPAQWRCRMCRHYFTCEPEPK